MGLGLMVVKFAAAFITLTVVIVVFGYGINRMLKSISDTDLSNTWFNIVIFSIYAVGITCGMHIGTSFIYISSLIHKSPEGVDKVLFWIYETLKACFLSLFGAALILLVLFVVSAVVCAIKSGVKKDTRG